MASKIRFRRFHLAAAGMALLAATCAAASAERHALLIGIGNYPQLYDLAGPRDDVEALAEALVESWGFAPENVIRLLDSQATKRAILDAFDRLLAESAPGDHVLVYYSGHGTGAFDGERRRGEGLLGQWTGALMPYDYAAGLPADPTPDEWADGLIVGRRDLEPRLSKLDRDRDVFLVFDSCFSGRTASSIAERAARWVSPPAFGKTRGIRLVGDRLEAPVFGGAAGGEPRHPYRKLIYLEGVPTHSLLEALTAGADAGRDERLTYSQLFERVHRGVGEGRRQLTRLFYPTADPDLVSRPVFFHDQRLPGSARALLELTYPRQDFALRLELPPSGGWGDRDRETPSPWGDRGGKTRRGVLYRGEGFEIVARADRPAVFVLVNVDRSGAVTVLYPAHASELAPATELREAFDVVPPYGTDNLKLFAFSRPPAGLAYWVDRQVEAHDPRLAELLELLAHPDGERAETRLEVVTSERGRIR